MPHEEGLDGEGVTPGIWDWGLGIRETDKIVRMASLIEAIDIKRKMFFEYEGAPYHVLDVEVSRPTARGGQTLVRIKMRNLVTRAVFDKTFKAGEKFDEPDLVMVEASYLYADSAGLNFMDQESFDTLTLGTDIAKHFYSYEMQDDFAKDKPFLE